MGLQNSSSKRVTDRHESSRRRSRQRERRVDARQRGSIAVISGVTLLLMLGMFGMAIDLSQIYNRKVELNAVSKAAALAAARELNGTAEGVAEAVTQAMAVAHTHYYQYGGSAFTLPESALTFSKLPAPGGNWSDVTSAKATPAGLYYARVNTNAFDTAGELRSIFMGMFSAANATSRVADVAIAGRTAVRAIPLGICAMGAPASERVNTGSSGTSRELVEYGFRRGISYNLMRLNPNGTAPAHFVINPFLPPGTVGASGATSARDIRPFICAGTMWMPHLKGGAITIGQGFPLADVFNQLNSRFDLYEGDVGERCDPTGAPPDVNIMAYKFDLPLPWMTTSPVGQSAEESTDGGRLATKADLAEMPAAATPSLYGPLWNFAKAVPYSAYAASSTEPATGYTTFAPTQWGALYKPAPTAKNYPSLNPYISGLAAHTQQASSANRSKAERYRRVLNVPLLSCPAAIGSTSAEVLAVAKFFMTVPADGSHLFAEFAGIASDDALRGKVELFP